MKKDNTYYAIATEQGNSVKLEIRDTFKANVFKIYRLPGKIVSQPVMSGDTVTITLQIGIYKKLTILNVKTGKKTERIL
tara:strand:- start:45 stop:281 length:237 start_codon:yes stop_codon:yes gene_type:complete